MGVRRKRSRDGNDKEKNLKDFALHSTPTCYNGDTRVLTPRAGDKIISIYRNVFVVTNAKNDKGKISLKDADGNRFSITQEEYPDMRQRFLNS